MKTTIDTIYGKFKHNSHARTRLLIKFQQKTLNGYDVLPQDAMDFVARVLELEQEFLEQLELLCNKVY